MRVCYIYFPQVFQYQPGVEDYSVRSRSFGQKYWEFLRIRRTNDLFNERQFVYNTNWINQNWEHILENKLVSNIVHKDKPLVRLTRTNLQYLKIGSNHWKLSCVHFLSPWWPRQVKTRICHILESSAAMAIFSRDSARKTSFVAKEAILEKTRTHFNI
jgi:hypothetical protein